MLSRRLAGLLVGVLVAVAGAVSSAAPARAHALLAESTPADGATVPLDRPLTEVTLTFTEALDPLLTVIHVLDASGNRVETGKAEVPGAPTRARAPLAPLGPGSYTVTWRTTSTFDGHTTVGAVAFGVGVPVAAAGATAVQTGVQAPTVAAIAGRWLFYAGAVLLLGASVVGTLIVTRPAALPVLALNGAWAATALGLVLTIADHRASTRTSLANLLESSTGHKLKAQALAVAVTWLAVAWASLRPRRLPVAAVGAGAAFVMLERAMSGHADASSVPWFTVGVQWLHLVAVGAWVGGLAWLSLALRDGGAAGGADEGRRLARRFSTVATAALGLVVVTGTLRALDEVGAWSRLLDTSFGLTLLVKLGLFAALVALGAVSRYRHLAAATVAKWAGLRRTVRFEVGVGAAVLAATAVLAGLPPSESLARAERLQRPLGTTVTGADFATSARVRLVVAPAAAGPNRFDAIVVDYDTGRPAAAERVALRFELAGRADVSPPALPLTKDADQRWRGASSALSQDGRWTITAVVQTATDSVEVPMELEIGRAPG